MMEAAYTCHQSLARGEFCCFMIGKCLWGKIKGQFCLRVGESQIGINTAQHNTTQERVRVRGMEGKKTREEVEKSGMIDTWMKKHRMIYTGATKHPFILSIRDGTVDLEAFKTWLVGITFSFTYHTFCSAIFQLCFYTPFEFALSVEPLSQTTV